MVRLLLTSVGMDLRHAIDVACTAAMLAVVMRWLFRLDLELHWAVCIGTVGLLLEPWMTMHLGPHVLPGPPIELVIGAAVAMVLLAIARLVHASRNVHRRSRNSAGRVAS